MLIFTTLQSQSVDIDECDADPPVCDPARTTDCVNIDGDYRCRCKSGYHLSVSGHSCEGKRTQAAYMKVFFGFFFCPKYAYGALSAQLFHYSTITWNSIPVITFSLQYS